jgi:hypothetical protein
MQRKKILKFFIKKYTVYELDSFGSVQDPDVDCHKQIIKQKLGLYKDGEILHKLSE